MEEKERYKVYKDNRGNAYICDTIKNIDYKIYQEFVDLLNQQSKRIKELEEELDDAKRDYIPKLEFGLQRANKMGRDAGKENQQLKQQLAITEKALELAYEHIKEDLKCDDTQDDIYNYFKTQAKEMLENEQ